MNFKTFYIDNPNIQYTEVPSQDELFEKFYLIENPFQEDIVAIPDGCVDFQFVWNSDQCEGQVCGSFLQGKRSVVGTYCRCFGIKLRPGIQFAFMENMGEKLLNRRISMAQILEVSALEQCLSTCSEISELIEASKDFFHVQPLIRPHVIASSASHILISTPGHQRMSAVEETLGYSLQYINHIFHSYFGVSVKKYADIIRAQAAINCLESKDVMDAVFELGYYDQAHFIRNFKQYTSVTPKHYVELSRKSKKPIIV